MSGSIPLPVATILDPSASTRGIVGRTSGQVQLVNTVTSANASRESGYPQNQSATPHAAHISRTSQIAAEKLKSGCGVTSVPNDTRTLRQGIGSQTIVQGRRKIPLGETTVRGIPLSAASATPKSASSAERASLGRTTYTRRSLGGENPVGGVSSYPSGFGSVRGSGVPVSASLDTYFTQTHSHPRSVDCSLNSAPSLTRHLDGVAVFQENYSNNTSSLSQHSLVESAASQLARGLSAASAEADHWARTTGAGLAIQRLADVFSPPPFEQQTVLSRIDPSSGYSRTITLSPSPYTSTTVYPQSIASNSLTTSSLIGGRVTPPTTAITPRSRSPTPQARGRTTPPTVYMSASEINDNNLTQNTTPHWASHVAFALPPPPIPVGVSTPPDQSPRAQPWAKLTWCGDPSTTPSWIPGSGVPSEGSIGATNSASHTNSSPMIPAALQTITNSARKSRHLIVLCHGVLGGSGDWHNFVFVWYRRALEQRVARQEDSRYDSSTVSSTGDTMTNKIGAQNASPQKSPSTQSGESGVTNLGSEGGAVAVQEARRGSAATVPALGRALASSSVAPKPVPTIATVVPTKRTRRRLRPAPVEVNANATIEGKKRRRRRWSSSAHTPVSRGIEGVDVNVPWNDDRNYAVSDSEFNPGIGPGVTDVGVVTTVTRGAGRAANLTVSLESRKEATRVRHDKFLQNVVGGRSKKVTLNTSDFDFEFMPLELGRTNTFKGVEWLAEEACKQVEEYLTTSEDNFDSFSIIGHSLGGVYSKRLLTLRQNYPHFNALKPKNFITLATPHLGSRRRLTMGLSPIQTFTRAAVGATGAQLLLEDEAGILWADAQAAIPRLKEFSRLMAFANTQGDLIVTYPTSILHVGRCERAPPCATNGKAVLAVHRPDTCKCFLKGQAAPVSPLGSSDDTLTAQRSLGEETNPTPSRSPQAQPMPPTAQIAQPIIFPQSLPIVTTQTHVISNTITLSPNTPMPSDIDVMRLDGIETDSEARTGTSPVQPGSKSSPWGWMHRIIGPKNDARAVQSPTNKQTKEKKKKEETVGRSDAHYHAHFPLSSEPKSKELTQLYDLLDTLPWIRVDVKAVPAIRAHEAIVLKNADIEAMKEVVFTIMDNFVW